MNSFWIFLIIEIVMIAYAIKLFVSGDKDGQSSEPVAESLPVSSLTQNHSAMGAVTKQGEGEEELGKNLAGTVFDHDKFLFKQKHLTIGEKYYVYDEGKRDLIYIERPAHLFRNLLAVFGAVFVGLACILFVAVTALGGISTGGINGLQLTLAVLAMFILPAITFAFFCKIRQIKFYSDDSKKEQLLEIKQDFKYRPLHMSYTVLDERGAMIAKLRKDYIYNILRRKWVCKKSDGTIWCTILEDSIIRSLLRRVFGALFGALRTNFIIHGGTSQDMIGEFNRQFTITDQYVLDMSKDQKKILDRRVALAIGVLLDTGEKR